MRTVALTTLVAVCGFTTSWTCGSTISALADVQIWPQPLSVRYGAGELTLAAVPHTVAGLREEHDADVLTADTSAAVWRDAGPVLHRVMTLLHERTRIDVAHPLVLLRVNNVSEVLVTAVDESYTLAVNASGVFITANTVRITVVFACLEHSGLPHVGPRPPHTTPWTIVLWARPQSMVCHSTVCSMVHSHMNRPEVASRGQL